MFEIKKLSFGDGEQLQELIVVLRHVFEMTDRSLQTHEHIQTLLTRTDFVVFVVVHNGRIVGGLTAHVLPSVYTAASELFMYDIAVLPEFHRQGIGAALIQAVKSYCLSQDIRETFVNAQAEDGDAVKFYYATGGKAEQVIQFNYPVTE